MKKAIVFIDEYEALFPRRSAMTEYASVEVRSHQQILATFLEWSEGLRPKEYEPDDYQMSLRNTKASV